MLKSVEKCGSVPCFPSTICEERKIEENNTREILIFKNSEGYAVVYNQTVWLLFSFSAIHA